MTSTVVLVGLLCSACFLDFDACWDSTVICLVYSVLRYYKRIFNVKPQVTSIAVICSISVSTDSIKPWAAFLMRLEILVIKRVPKTSASAG